MNEQEQELRQVNKFINDLWQLIKKYYTPDPDPDALYWQELIAEANNVGEKHKGRLQWNLINAFLDYLDGKEYEMRKGREMQ